MVGVRLCLAICLIFGGCEPWPEEGEQKGKLLAKVEDEKLYEADLNQIFNANLSKKDSIQLQKDYIRSWIQEKLMYYDALDKLPESKKNKEEALQSYYESLIRYEYEQEMLQNYLDTAINESKVREFYKNNESRFKLDRPVLKYHYMIFSNEDHPFDRLRKWFQSDNPTYLDSLYYYAETRARNFSIEKADWQYYNEVPVGFDLPNENRMEFLRDTKFHSNVDSTGKAYVIYIHDYKAPGKIAPMSVKRSNIRQILINQNKKKLLEKQEKELYEEGIQSNKAKRYD